MSVAVPILSCEEVQYHPVALEIGLKFKIISQTCRSSV